MLIPVVAVCAIVFFVVRIKSTWYFIITMELVRETRKFPKKRAAFLPKKKKNLKKKFVSFFAWGFSFYHLKAIYCAEIRFKKEWHTRVICCFAFIVYLFFKSFVILQPSHGSHRVVKGIRRNIRYSSFGSSSSLESPLNKHVGQRFQSITLYAQAPPPYISLCGSYMFGC